MTLSFMKHFQGSARLLLFVCYNKESIFIIAVHENSTFIVLENSYNTCSLLNLVHKLKNMYENTVQLCTYYILHVFALVVNILFTYSNVHIFYIIQELVRQHWWNIWFSSYGSWVFCQLVSILRKSGDLMVELVLMW